MRYRAVLFDNDDTLMDFQAGNRNAINQLMDELAYHDPNRYEQYETVNLECWAELEQGRLNQSQLRLERFVRFFDRYPVQGDARQAAERFAWLLGQQSIMMPHAENVVREIARRLPVVIVTNGISSIQRNRFSLSPLQTLVTNTVISEEIGISKPDPEIFFTALRPLEVLPEDALMIGDGINSDIRGANNAGMDVCWLNPAGRALPSDVHVEYMIRDIRECVQIALQP